MVNGIGFLIIILFIGFGASANEACYELFYPPATQVLSMPSRFTVRSLIPEAFVQELESAYGPLQITIDQFKGIRKTAEKASIFSDQKHFYSDYEKTHTSLLISISAGKNRPVFRFQLAIENNAPHRAEVIYLELMNPLGEAHTARLHQVQRKKGIPFDVLIETRKRLFAYLFSKGIRQLTVQSMSDYTVSILYRRFLGFYPATPWSANVFETIDDIYEKAKKLSPELRPKSIDDFSRTMLRLLQGNQVFYEARAELLKFKSGLELKPTTRILHDDLGQLFAVVLDYGLETQKIYFLHEDKFLWWREISANKGTELQIDLVP